jgi:hypothetical protein
MNLSRFGRVMERSPGYFTLRSFLERKGEESKVRVMPKGTVQNQVFLEVRPLLLPTESILSIFLLCRAEAVPYAPAVTEAAYIKCVCSQEQGSGATFQKDKCS